MTRVRSVNICNCLSVLLWISILNDGIYAQWAIDDEGCRTPDGGVGDCIQVKKCKTMINFLQDTPKPLTEEVKARLRAYVCAYEGGTINGIKVCCPLNPIDITIANTTAVKRNESFPPPPDVSGHKNYNLLPQDCGYLSSDNKITNGQTATLNEFPWMALLFYKTSNGIQFRCGGSVINDKWILTAAHCVTNLADPLVGVRAGEYNTDTDIDCENQENGTKKCAPPVQNLTIEQIQVHPQFNISDVSNDIALLKVTKMNISRNYVRPVCLPIKNSREEEFKYGTVTGWGATDSGRNSNVLQKVNIPVVNLQNCIEAYKNQTRAHFTYKQICAGGEDRKDSCIGDSGGPLHVVHFLNDETTYVQQGIVSFGPRICGWPGFPGIYTRITYYMEWILDTIGN